MSELYNPTIFYLLQNEYELFEAYSVKNFNIQTSSIDYVISMEMDLGWRQMFFDSDKNSINYPCCMFERFCILCCYCLIIFSVNLYACRCKDENPAKELIEVLMTTTMIKAGGNNF